MRRWPSSWTARPSRTCRRPGPEVEAFVHGPTVEGIHLRAGLIARGGLRWSERPTDFRTEVLDLAFAQVKKNAIIVPTGAKGGFVCRRPGRRRGVGPTPEEVRGGLRGVRSSACSTSPTTWSAGEVVTPPRVVAWDGPDPYLVVAADKGTATFSDLANAAQRGVRVLAGRRLRVRGVAGLRPQGHGHHGPGCLGGGAPAFPPARDRRPDRSDPGGRRRRHVRRRVRQRHAAQRARSAWWRPSTTVTCSSIPTPIRRPRSPSGSAWPPCPGPSWADYRTELISDGRGGLAPRRQGACRSPGRPAGPRRDGRLAQPAAS